MNYFAHGRDHLDDPYFVAGTAVPDWLSVVDRKVRVRARHALDRVADEDPRIAAVARGIVRHHEDDDWFHRSRAFLESSAELALRFRSVLAGDQGYRPGFLGHITVEMLLDATLIEEDPPRLADYYATLAGIDPLVVQAAVAAMAPRRTDRLSALIRAFVHVRFLEAYADDRRLCHRIDQVLARVRLRPLPLRFMRELPACRTMVRARRSELMTPTEPLRA